MRRSHGVPSLYGGDLRISREQSGFFKMSLENPKPRRKLRADSLRNRELLLQAAADIFSGADGPQASLEAVARKAGVGIGTFYRHFPTRDALFEAVYRQEVDHLGDLAETLGRDNDPVDALRKWLHANVRLVATKKGMAQALQLAAPASSELRAYSSARMIGAIRLLMDRAIVAGGIRADLPPEDLMRALVGIFYSQGTADWQPMALRLVDLLVAGLRQR